MKRQSKLAALPLATALALAALVPTLALSPGTPPQADPAQAATSTPAPLKSLGTDDLARVKSTGKLLVGVSADYPPYEYYDSKLMIDGFDPALIRDLGKRIGAKEVELNDFAFEGLLAALQLGQVDVAISAVAVTEERRGVVDFTNVYFIGADAVLAARGYASDKVSTLNDLARKCVAAQRGTVYAAFLQKNLVDKGLSRPTDLFLYQDIDSAIRDLKAGKFDLLLMDRLPARQFAKADAGVKVVGENFTPQRFAIAVRKGSNLRSALNDALLKAQNDGTVSKLIEQYLGIAKDQVEPIPPPTPEPTAVPPPTATPGPPPCIAAMKFVADLNVPDGTQFQPGQAFSKGWRVQNSGNCDWQPGFYLAFAFGNTPAARMSGQPAPVGKIIKPGATADISVNLVAPGQPGTYQGFWQMHDADGTPFGERIWVQIVVPGAPPPPPPPPPTPVPGISFNANPTTIAQGQCTTFNWSVSGVQGVWFFPQDQPWQNYGVPGVSSQQQCPQQTTTYFLRVQFNDGSVQQPQITIVVNPAASGPVIQRFTADPSQVTLGQAVNIQWQVDGVTTRIAILRNGAPIWDGAPATGSYNDVPQSVGSVTYGIQAFDTQNQAVQTSRTVIVGDPGSQPPVINSFRVEPAAINLGQCVLISWDAGGGTTLVRIYRNYITQTELAIDGTKVQGSGLQDCPPATGAGQIGYRLDAINAQGQTVSRDVVVEVRAISPR